MTDAAVKRLIKARNSSRSGTSTALTKCKTMSELPTPDLCQKTIKTMLTRADKHDTQRNNYESISEVLKLDGDDLTEIQATTLEEHTDAFQAAMDELEELTDGLANLSCRAIAYAELESFQEMLDLVDVRPGYRQDLARVLREYAHVYHRDRDLKDKKSEIGALLNELSSRVPEEEPHAAPAHGHVADRDRDPDRHTPHQRKLPIIEIPKFSGDILEWEDFWSIFNRNVHTNRDLAEDEKRAYLQQAIRDKSQSNLVDSLSGRYDDCVASLKARYDQPRKLHQHHTKALFTCKPCKNETKQELTRLHATISNARRKLMDSKHFTGDDLIESFVEGLLPPNMWMKWAEQERDQHVIPKTTDLLAFIEFQANLAQRGQRESPKPRHVKEAPPERPRYERKIKQEYGSQARTDQTSARPVHNGSACTACKEGGHPIYYCPSYDRMTVDQRQAHVRKHKLCFNCLSRSHDTRGCHSTYTCRKCGKSHHSTLHKESSSRTEPEPQPASVEQVAAAAIVVQGPPKVTQVLLPTLHLTAHGPGGRTVDIRALLDSGSTISILKSKVARQLQLAHHPTSINITGVKENHIGTTESVFTVKLTSPHMEGVAIQMTAYLLSKVAGILPLQPVKQSWPFLDKLPLADPYFKVQRDVDLILGSDVFGDIVQDGMQVGPHDFPIATKTIFGWIVQGRTEAREVADDSLIGPATSQSYHFVTPISTAERLLAAQQEETDISKRFYAAEDMAPATTEITPEEKLACHSFDTTHHVTVSGRMSVTLPRKGTDVQLGTSRPQAVRRYFSNERSLLKRGNWEAFQQVVNEYLVLGHAEPVPRDQLHPSGETYYMPMHAVTKESSTSTKLRVVFDASAATSNGRSFNETLAIGPTVHPSLVNILQRFRTKKIAITSDITKMYRAIELAPQERDYQHFVWRDHPDKELQDFRMTRVTFGVAASPFLATRALKQVATLSEVTHPRAAEAVHTSFYVDDCITGADTIPEAIELRRQLQNMLDPYELTLRKWRSSSAQVMDSIPLELHERKDQPEAYGDRQYLKTLGIHWDADGDKFYVSTSHLQLPERTTKRLLTSDVHRTFDVLGWYTPVTLIMKILIQELWEKKYDWDDTVPLLIQEAWTEWRDTLPELTHHPINRYYYRPHDSPCNLQLHGFSDASIKAFAAVVYVRAEYDNGPATVTLVTAKSRVAPLKPMTIPRLELCGAYLLARLITQVREALKISPTNVSCWTDSTIVINWLDGSPRRYRTYVANRIVNILELVPSSSWKHVPTAENPADCASRGVMPQELIDHDLWWTGPKWLLTTPIKEPPQPTLKSEELELKVEALIAVTNTTRPWLVLDFSSYPRLTRVVAWIRRYVKNRCSRPEDRVICATLTVSEITYAEAVLHRQAQERSFNTRHPTKWKQDPSLKSLNPFKDDHGRLRVGGRLGNSELLYAQMHPVILHATDPLTKLIVTHQHKRIGHAGPLLLMTNLSREYHLIRGMRLVKTVCRDCVRCKRHQVKKEVQIMGQLPRNRVSPSAPFQCVGTDFAPILTKHAFVRRPTIIKAYVCIFICMATKAVHLEPVTDLSTDAFLSCLQRFINRRGKPTNIHSDNGTNFVGAAKELDRMFELMKSDATPAAIQDYCSAERIIWHFNPERAPHFGGIWEAAVRSMKYHLRRIVGNVRLSFMELNDVLTRIEAILNSRPLVPFHSHSDEAIDVLTPGHFLIGRPLEAIPDGTRLLNISLRKRWNLVKQITHEFWTRWSREYLRCLQQRGKWTKEQPNIRVGDIVLIREDGVFSQVWPMARVTKVYPGTDGHVRVVDLKLGQSIFKRPITKLSVLVATPEEGDEEDSEQEEDGSLATEGYLSSTPVDA